MNMRVVSIRVRDRRCWVRGEVGGGDIRGRSSNQMASVTCLAPPKIVADSLTRNIIYFLVHLRKFDKHRACFMTWLHLND